MVTYSKHGDHQTCANTLQDAALLQLSARFEGFDWDTIAKHMPTGRTAWTCFSRYQKSLNNAITKVPVTANGHGNVLTKVDDERFGLVSVDIDQTGRSWTYQMWQQFILMFKRHSGRCSTSLSEALVSSLAITSKHRSVGPLSRWTCWEQVCVSWATFTMIQIGGPV